MKRLDDGLHLEVVALSVGIAFRHQLLAVKHTPELLAAHFDAMPNPYMRAVQREVVPAGVESPRVRQAVQAFATLVVDMEAVLGHHAWLAGDALTLADIAYAPYITRLEHLALSRLWRDKPAVAAWYARLRATAGYTEGLTRWFKPKYLSLMHEAGSAAEHVLFA
jgi:glutathione S-transferase